MSGNENVQDKASVEPTAQTETTKPNVDSEEQNGFTKTKKRLFVCCDGTWQNAASSMRYSTNVARFARCVDRLEPDGYERTLKDGRKIRDHVMQVVWYSGGVGTYFSLVPETMWSGLTGAGVTSIILNAYYFLSSNYNFGCHEDEIILVGYSRGAFTVRCLAEFISKVGLLRRVALPFLGLLFQLWVNGKEEELKQLQEKLAPPVDDNSSVDGALLHPVKINVLAEFDPVSALVDPFQWFRSKNKGIASVRDQVPSEVKNAFLAVALNEKRSEFEPMLWKTKLPGQVVKQCAFLGCHGDIGGGNADSGLSQLPLLWMIGQVRQATIDESGSEAQFDENLLLQFATPSAVGYPRDMNRDNSTRDELSLFETFSSTKGEITESFTLPWKAYYHLLKRPLTLWYGQGGHDRVLTIGPSGSETAHAIQDSPHGEDQDEHDQSEHDEDGDDQREHDQREHDQHVCRLNIHFSVHMLHKNRGERQQDSEAEGTFVYHLDPLEGYERKPKQEKGDHVGATGHRRFSWNKSSGGHCFEEQAPGEIEKKLLGGWVERAEQWWERSSQPDGPAKSPEQGLEEVDAWLRFIKNWDSEINFERNRKETLVFFFKERLQKDELFQPSSPGSAIPAASLSSSSSSKPEIPKDHETTRRSASSTRARTKDHRKRARSRSPYKSRIRSSRMRRKYEK